MHIYTVHIRVIISNLVKFMAGGLRSSVLIFCLLPVLAVFDMTGIDESLSQSSLTYDEEDDGLSVTTV